MSDYVQSFDSLDDMMAAMAAAEDIANARLTPGQIALRDDMGHTRYWARALPDYDLVVYGRAETTGYLATCGVGFDPTDNRERGYLTGTAFSAWEPGGEFGDTHVADVIPIDFLVFESAKAKGWPTYSMLHEDERCRSLARMLAISERQALG
jgi:hypothetical protein